MLKSLEQVDRATAEVALADAVALVWPPPLHAPRASKIAARVLEEVRRDLGLSRSDQSFEAHLQISDRLSNEITAVVLAGVDLEALRKRLEMHGLGSADRQANGAG